MERPNIASRAPDKTRWQPLLAILLFAFSGIYAIHVLDVIDPVYKPPLLAAVGLAAGWLVGLWVLFGVAAPVVWRIIAALFLVILITAITARSAWRAKDIRWSAMLHLNYNQPSHRVGPPPPPAVADEPKIATGPNLRPVDLATTTSDDFPEFLGPLRADHILGTELNSDWAAHPPKELWRQRIGSGWSSFAVVNGFAVTMEQRGPSEMTVCYEVSTGKARWFHANAVEFSEENGGTGPRATPTIVSGKVYVMGCTGILDCLEGATGKRLWTRNVLTDSKSSNLPWGKTTSPLVVDDLVIVSGGEAPPALLAYRTADGAPAWTAGDDHAGYSSPALLTLDGVRQIVSVNADSVTGHAITDGRVLWRYEWKGTDIKVGEPVAVSETQAFVSAGYGVGSVLIGVTRDAQNAFTAKTLWTTPHMKSKFSNHVLQDGFIYGLDDGTLTCIDASTGKKMWRGESYGYGQLIGVDNLLLVAAESGDIVLVAASPDAFKELAQLPALHSKNWTNPTLSGHHLLLRNDTEAVCYDLP